MSNIKHQPLVQPLSRYVPFQLSAPFFGLHRYRTAGKHVCTTGNESDHVGKNYDHGDKLHLSDNGDNEQ